MDFGIVRRLVESFRRLPGISQRSAERIAFALLQDPALHETITEIQAVLAESLLCPTCGWFTRKEEPCVNCARDQRTICVVEGYSDLLGIVRTGEFGGSFHILGGLIAPLEGTLPEDLSGAQLLRRVGNGGVEEVILALPATIEGEATVHYLRELLAPTGVVVSRIARGLPTNAKIEYLDRKTIENAFRDRVKVT